MSLFIFFTGTAILLLLEQLLPVMLRPTSLVTGIVPLLLSNVFAAPATSGPSFANLDSFVSTERAIALQGALNNIGPNGSLVPGAGAGFVVASPSMVNPDCESHFVVTQRPLTILWLSTMAESCVITHLRIQDC